MNEQTDGYVGTLLPDHLGQHQQVVVVYPQDVPFLQEIQDLFCIQAVDLHIGLPADFAVGHVLGEIMEQGPEGIPGKTVRLS